MAFAGSSYTHRDICIEASVDLAVLASHLKA